MDELKNLITSNNEVREFFESAIKNNIGYGSGENLIRCSQCFTTEMETLGGIKIIYHNQGCWVGTIETIFTEIRNELK